MSGSYFESSGQAALKTAADETPVPVDVSNFVRAETDLYFGRAVKEGGFGKLSHRREMARIDDQIIVRMNRDTIYSSGVFDLEAAPITITLPDSRERFMSMQVVSQNHFTIEVAYSPGPYTYTRKKVGTRYVFIIVRTLANPQDPSDMKRAHVLQDSILVAQTKAGKFEVPNWEQTSQDKLRRLTCSARLESKRPCLALVPKSIP